MEERLQLLHPVDVDDRGPVNAHEAARIQTGFEKVHSLPKQMRAAAHVELHVIVVRFDPIDLRGAHQKNSAGISDRDPLKKGFGGRQLLELFLTDTCPSSFERPIESLIVKGFEQIVD